MSKQYIFEQFSFNNNEKKLIEVANILYDLNLEVIDTGSGLVVTEENMAKMCNESAYNLKAA